jgi:hypothetical protein
MINVYLKLFLSLRWAYFFFNVVDHLRAFQNLYKFLPKISHQLDLCTIYSIHSNLCRFYQDNDQLDLQSCYNFHP